MNCFKNIIVRPTGIFMFGAVCVLPLHAQFVNHGLVGVGRIPADTFDKFGHNLDNLGGVFSAMAFDQSSFQFTKDHSGDSTYSGILFGQPDRGYSNGTTDFHPRIEIFDISITPDYTATALQPAAQNQISLVNIATTIFTDGLGNHFTGFDADSVNTQFPQSAGLNGPAFNPTSEDPADPKTIIPNRYLGGGALSLDPEGIVHMADGSFFTSDEYGPVIYHFSVAGVFEFAITPPAAFHPLDVNGSINFTANIDSKSGRQNNKGFEGLTITPDQQHLVAILQSPLQQDGPAATASQPSNGANGKNTRICVFSVQTGALEHEYVYTLANAVDASNKAVKTTVSEIAALNEHQFLVDERDSLGRGSGKTTPPAYKTIVLIDTDAATDIAGSAYDKAVGEAGQANLPSNAAGLTAAGLHAVARQDFVSLIDKDQLAKFGLNANADTKTGISADVNSLSDKWEGVTLIPLRDANNPDDFLLLVGNDNDFKANAIYENGVLVGGTGANGTEPGAIDTMVLAYRVTLPGATVFSKFDLNHDGCVDRKDFAIITAAVHTRSNDSLYDLNGDGEIDLADIQALELQFTNPNGVPCHPEHF